MLCNKCGQEIKSELQFCPNCGCETGYTPKSVNTGKKLGILSIVFAFELTIVGFILGIIGLVKGIKSKDKLSITLNTVGIVISIAFTILYTIKIVAFFKEFNSLIN